MPIDVSVVVPVYNTEKYLPECIESLIRQTLRNVEFIFVDDGSTDRSVEIIEEYQRKDDRIRLIKQKNQYAGVARNNGMKAATGKYIIFLDSDDFFELTMLEEAFTCAEEKQAEITVFWYSTYDNDCGTIEKIPNPDFPDGVFCIGDVGERFIDYYRAAPWNKLFLRSFIEDHSLQFQSSKKCNDTYFTHMAAYLASRIVFLRNRFVFYRVNNQESLQGDFNRNRDSFVDCQVAIKAKLTEQGIFVGVNKCAYNVYTKSLIRYSGNIENANMDSFRQYFVRVKKALVPELFDSEDDFCDDPFIMQIYQGTFESFLLFRASELSKQVESFRDMVNNMVSKQSKDYMIGHAILAVPRLIMKCFRR